jgi:predicted amidohydrolase YtcJ
VGHLGVRKDLATGEVIAPDERLNILEALRLYTFNGAYAGFEESKKGSLEPGKLAHFIVVDKDVLSIPHDQLKDVASYKAMWEGNWSTTQSTECCMGFPQRSRAENRVVRAGLLVS